MLRWGILSCAKIAIDHLIPAILKSENAIISAIASRDISRAQNIAERFAIPLAFGSYEELLASDDVDAIYIPLPTSHHVEWTIKCANAGKHVLCEKPIALHADQIDDIIEARDRNKVIICEAFMVTYHPQWHKVHALLSSGKIGSLRHVQSVFTYHNLDPDNMRNQTALGGGALPDIGVYPIVTTRFVTGAEPIRVSARIDFDSKFNTDIFTNCMIEFEQFSMSMTVSTQLALRQEISFNGNLGWIELASPFNAGLYDKNEVRHHNADHTLVEGFAFPGHDQYQSQIEAFSRAVMASEQSDSDALFSLENSKKNQQVIDAIYRAGKSGNWENV